MATTAAKHELRPAVPVGAKRPPRVAARLAEVEGPLEPVYVWDLVVRITHWTIALSILVLAITGLYIGHPLETAHGPAVQSFVTGWARVVHFYTSIAFGIAVLCRLIWLFLGPRRSSWRNFVPASRRRWKDLGETLKFYTLIRPTPPRTIGHNPLAGLSYIGVFCVYVFMIATGWALYSVSSHSYMQTWRILLPVFHGAQGARWLHHAGMWVLIVFFVAHIFLSLLTSRNEKNGTMDSIFSGYKYLPKGTPPDDAAE